MKTAMGVILAILAASGTALAQDLSNFYVISGFRLPALQSGQYELTVTPRYSVRPSDYASQSDGLSATGASTTTSLSGTSYYTPYNAFSANSSFIYGLSNQTTMSVGLTYLPLHTYGVRNVFSSSATDVTPSGAQTTGSSDGTLHFQEESIASSLTIAHRLQPNVELSLTASWSFSKSPYSSLGSGSSLHDSGGLTPTFTTTNTSSNGFVSSNGHAFDISATLVVLGY